MQNKSSVIYGKMKTENNNLVREVQTLEKSLYEMTKERNMYRSMYNKLRKENKWM